MSIIKKTDRTDRMDIYIEEEKNIILIQEKWKYNWLTKITPWISVEKKKFHELADFKIWKNWRGDFKLKVRGTSSFAVKHKNTTFTIDFDIKWVFLDPHWEVNVTKIAPGEFEQNKVKWKKRIINLYTEDTKINTRHKYGNQYHQYWVAHEFGHAISNSYLALNERKSVYVDECSTNNKVNGGFKLDHFIAMNIKKQLKSKYSDYILTRLNSMIPNTTFYII